MKLTIREVAAIKRNAQNVAAYVIKKQKIEAQVAELKAEYDKVCATIKGYDAGTLALTEGKYLSEDLITRVVESTGKTDANGRDIKVTKYVPKAGVLVLDEDGKGYTVVDADLNPEYKQGQAPVEEQSPEVPMNEAPAAESFDPTFGAE